jgi:hypothetical protein
MAPPPKITADYLINELGLVVGKETFEARSLGRLAEVSERERPKSCSELRGLS